MTLPNSLSLQHFPLQNSSNTIICDISTGQPRPVVPPAYRQPIFHSLLELHRYWIGLSDIGLSAYY